MAVYLYRCADHGIIEVPQPMGTALRQWTCPECRQVAVRLFTAPRLSLGSPTRRALIDSTEQSRDEPAVVSLPPSRRSPVPVAPRNPALARLPRP